MKNHVFALLLCLIAFSGNCQKDTSHQTAITTSKKTEKASEGLTERQAYKLLYENQKEANSSILNTIYFALSGILAIAVAIVFFQWRVNTKKVNDAKDEAIALVKTQTAELLATKNNEINQLQQQLQQEIANKANDLTNQIKDFEVKAQNDAQAGNKQLTGEFEKLIASYNDNLSGQIKSLETIMNERATSNNERILGFEKLLDKKIENQNSALKLLQKKVEQDKSTLENQLRARIARVEATLWRRTGIIANALLDHLTEAELNFESNPFMLDMSLKSVIECLKEMKELDIFLSNKLHAFAKRIPSDNEYYELVKEMEILAKALPIVDEN